MLLYASIVHYLFQRDCIIYLSPIIHSFFTLTLKCKMLKFFLQEEKKKEKEIIIKMERKMELLSSDK